MSNVQIPSLSDQEMDDGIIQARNSDRKRFPKLLHKQGDVFNKVFNFMMHDSYMQPHLHPGSEKIEHIYLIKGRIAALFFDDAGEVKQCAILETGSTELIVVPAFTWHTYVMLTDYAVTYETMVGVYKQETWKEFANWAPREDSLESPDYLALLKRVVPKLTL
jgi:cupin fold WbuC family metalloprotein